MDFQKESIAEFEAESALSRKILAAIPSDVDFSWKPSPKSFSIGRLAGHLSDTTGEWGLHTLSMDKLEFAAGHKFEPYVPQSTEAMLEKFDKQVAEVKTALAVLDPAKWDDNWQFVYGGQAWINDTRYRVWRTWVINHAVHHRAQLGVDLRLLGIPIPGTYGPSADES